MSYDVSSILSSLGSRTSSATSYTGSLTSGNNNSNGLELLSQVLGSSSTSGSSNDLLTGMMIGMLSGGSSSSSILGTDSTSNTTGTSSSSGFNMIMSSLLNALSEKERQTQQGIDQNSQNASSNGISEISDVIIRALGGTSSTGSTSTSISTSGSNLERIENAITSSSQKYGVSADLIRAIIKTESNYDPNAVSSAGAKGLMQLMPANLASYGVSDPFNIEQNIDAGTRHIKGNLTKYGNDTNMALAAYNYGSGNMASRGITSSSDFYKLPTETKNYLQKINSLL